MVLGGFVMFGLCCLVFRSVSLRGSCTELVSGNVC